MGLRFAFVWLTAVLVNVSASAQSTWSNPLSGNWSVGGASGNWSGATAPTSNLATNLVFGGSTQYTAIDNIGAAGFNLNSLTFNNSWAGTGYGVTITAVAAQTINFPATTAAPAVTQNGSGSVFLNLPLTFANTQAVTPVFTIGGTGGLNISSINFGNTNNATFTGAGTGDFTIGTFTLGTGTAAFTFNGAGNTTIGSLVKGNGNKTFTNNLPAGKQLAIGTIALNAANTNNQVIFDGTGTTAVTGVISELTAGANAGVLVKNGSGTTTFSGTNTYTGATTINAGILSVSALANIGTPSNIGSGDITSATTNTASLIFNGGTLQYTGSTIAIDRGFTLNTNGGKLDIVTGSTLTFGGIVAGAGSLTKAISTGTLILNGANTYSGPTVVLGGILTQGNATAFGTSKSFSVASGAFLDASLAGIAITSGGSLTAGRTTSPVNDVLGNVSLTGATLNVGGAAAATYTHAGDLTLNGSTLQFGLGNVNTLGGGINDLVAVTGNLTFTGTNNVVITALNGPLANGNYTLFTYTGTFTGSPSNFAAPTGLPAGRSTYSYDTTNTPTAGSPGSVLLVVTGQAATLTWIGNGTTNSWDATTAGVWTGATPDSFFDGDLVNFTDTGIANGTVNLVGTLQPLSVSVNSAGNYTFAGTGGSIAGNASLTKDGTGRLTVQNVNTYTGTTTIIAGVISLQNANGLGTTGTATVAAGAALELQGGIAYAAKPLTLNGTGVSNGGALVNVSGNNSWAGSIAIASSTLIQSNLNDLSLNGALTGTGLLTINGIGTITFGGAAGSAFTGSTTITTGTTVNASIANALPSGTDISLTGILNLNGFSQTIKSLAGSGNVTLGSNSATVLTVNLGLTTFSGVISGSGGLSRLNSGNGAGFSLTLTNKQTYSGTTNIQNTNATLRLGITDALPIGTTLTFLGTTNTNANLDLNGFNQTIAAITSATTTGSAFVQNNSGSGTSVLTITNGAGVFSVTTGTARIRDNDGATTGGKVALTIAGGTTTFAGTQTYTGVTTISGGTLKSGVASIIANSASVSIGAAGTFDLGGFAQTVIDLQGTGTVTSNAAAALTVTTANFSGLITGATSLIKGNGGTASITGTANTFTGTVTVNNGTLELYSLADSGAGANGSGAIKILNTTNANATLRYLGAGSTTTRAIDIFATTGPGNANIDASGTGSLVLGGASQSASTTGKTLALLGTNTGDNTFAGVISDGAGPLTVTKSGTGTWVFSGNNTYTGTTTITGGTLKVIGQTGTNSGTGTGVVTVGTATANSGTLSGNGQVGGNLIVNAGGTLAPGNGTAAIGTLTVGTDTTTAATATINGTYEFDITPGGNNRLILNGSSGSVLNFSSTTVIRLSGSTNYNGTFDNTQMQSWTLAAIPTGATANGLGAVTFDATNFASIADGATWNLATSGNNLVLNYVPATVPEPTAILGIASVGFGLVALRRRTKTKRV